MNRLRILVYVGFALYVWAQVYQSVQDLAMYRPLDPDPGTYLVMASQLARTGSLLDIQGLPTHHFPPLLPIILSIPYWFGFSTAMVRLIVNPLLAAAIVIALVRCTEKMFGMLYASMFGLILMTNSYINMAHALGYADPLAMGFYGVTVFFIHESVKAPRNIRLAGLFAGLGYLTKASIGPLMVVAASCGVAWRLKHGGKAALTQRDYLVGALIFLGIASTWITRNVFLFGMNGWDTQPYATKAVAFAVVQPMFLPILLVKTGMGFLFVLMCGGMFGLFMFFKGINWTKLKDARGSLLAMSTILVVVISQVYSTAFYFSEHQASIINYDERYVFPAVPTFLWLCLYIGKAASQFEALLRSGWAAVRHRIPSLRNGLKAPDLGKL